MTDHEVLLLLRSEVNKFVKWSGSYTKISSGMLLEVGPSDSNETAKTWFPDFTVETMDVLAHINPTYVAGIDQDTSGIIPRERFDLLIATEVLEHVRNPWAAVNEMKSLLKVGGCAVITTPFNLFVHTPYPDCWRFTHFGLQELFKDWKIEYLFGVPTPGRPDMPIGYHLVARKQ